MATRADSKVTIFQRLPSEDLEPLSAIGNWKARAKETPGNLVACSEAFTAEAAKTSGAGGPLGSSRALAAHMEKLLLWAFSNSIDAKTQPD